MTKQNEKQQGQKGTQGHYTRRHTHLRLTALPSCLLPGLPRLQTITPVYTHTLTPRSPYDKVAAASGGRHLTQY